MAQELRTAAIESVLRRRSTARQALAITAILAGALLTLLAPFVVGTLFWFSTGMLLDRWYPWWWLFAGLAGVSIPLLFRPELRTGGRYLDDTVRQTGAPSATAELGVLGTHIALGSEFPLLARVATSPRLSAAGRVELFLAGPRFIVTGYRQLRTSRKSRQSFLRSCAQIVENLLISGSALPLSSLASGAEQSPDLVVKLAWLSYHGWVGVTEKADRVFLYSQSRDALGGVVQRGL